MILKKAFKKDMETVIMTVIKYKEGKSPCYCWGYMSYF